MLLADTVLDSHTGRPVIGQLIDAFEEYGGPITALEEVPLERISSYGVIDGEEIGQSGIYQVRDFIEKPAPEEAPSRLAIASRYLFTPEIFDALRHTARGKGNEIQLTDAMRQLVRNARCSAAGSPAPVTTSAAKPDSSAPRWNLVSAGRSSANRSPRSCAKSPGDCPVRPLRKARKITSQKERIHRAEHIEKSFEVPAGRECPLRHRHH